MSSMKFCTKCKTEKSFEKFAKNKGRKDGRQSYCKDCQNLAHKEKYRNDESYRQARLEGKRGQKRHRHYKLSEEEYQALLGKYQGLCHACQINPCKVIDHDHSCCSGHSVCGNCVRGLLCNQCNVALGLLKDSSEIISRLLVYLGRYDREDR